MRATIINLLDVEGEEWNNFVFEHPYGNLFHTTFWARVLYKTYKYKPLVFALRHGRQVQHAQLAFLVNTPFWGKRLVSNPFSDYAGPLVDSSDNFESIFTSLIKPFIEENQIKYMEIRSANPDLELNNLKKIDHYFTYLIDLNKDETQLWRSLRKGTKYSVKKAQKMGVKVKIDNSLGGLKTLYKLNTLTRKKHGIPMQPFRFFLNIWKELVKRGYGYIFLARIERNPVGGIMLLVDNKMGYLKYSGAVEKYLNLGITHLIWWEALIFAKRLGLSYLDLGRTDANNEGLIAFKKGWGAEEVKLYYFFYPQPMGVYTKGSERESAYQKFFRMLPPFFNRTVGEIIYKFIG